jgi:zinc transport system substrate-binding protein
MLFKKNIITLFLIIFILFIMLFSCKSNKSTHKILFVSIEPYKYIVDFLTENNIETKTIMSKNQDPHTFEITPKELENILNSYAYLKTNLPFENIIIDKINSQNNNLNIYDISKDLRLIFSTDNNDYADKHNEEDNEKEEKDHIHDEPYDIHIWISLNNLKIISKNIYDFLLLNYKELNPIIEKNYKNLIEKLNFLDNNFSKLIKSRNIKYIFVFHPLFSYFCRDYNLNQIVLEFEGKEPSLSTIKDIFNIIKNNNIKVFFISPQFPTSYADIFKNELNLKVEIIDFLSYNILDSFETLYNILANNY